MRRSPVKVGAKCAAMCAAMCAVTFVSSFASAQQPPVPTPRQAVPAAPPPRPQAPAAEAPAPTTWTLFLVTVPFKGTWTVTSIGSFNTKGTAYTDCLHAIGAIDRIPGIRESNTDAKKAEGSAEYMICLPATASQSRGGGGGGGDGGGGQGGGGE